LRFNSLSLRGRVGEGETNPLENRH